MKSGATWEKFEYTAYMGNLARSGAAIRKLRVFNGNNKVHYLSLSPIFLYVDGLL